MRKQTNQEQQQQAQPTREKEEKKWVWRRWSKCEFCYKLCFNSYSCCSCCVQAKNPHSFLSHKNRSFNLKITLTPSPSLFLFAVSPNTHRNTDLQASKTYLLTPPPSCPHYAPPSPHHPILLTPQSHSYSPQNLHPNTPPSTWASTPTTSP